VQRRHHLGELGLHRALLLEGLRILDRHRGVGGQRREQLDLPVAELPAPTLRGQQHPDGLSPDQQRHAEDALEPFVRCGLVDRSEVREPLVVEVVATPQRVSGPHHLATESGTTGQHDAAQHRTHRAVDHLDAQAVLVVQQHQVGDIHGQEPSGLPGDLVQQLVRAEQRGQPTSEVVQHGQLIGTLAALVQPGPDPGGELRGRRDDLPVAPDAVIQESSAVCVQLHRGTVLGEQLEPGPLLRTDQLLVAHVVIVAC